MKAQTMRRLRQLHHYAGVFFAPAILLFALSGALQTFRLQEDKGYGGTPPGWIIWMASVHKDQSWPKPEQKQKAPQADEKPKLQTEGQPAKQMKQARLQSTLPLKIFVLLLSIGLIVSTILGVIIALNNRSMRRVSIIMLASGTAIPLLLLMV